MQETKRYTIKTNTLDTAAWCRLDILLRCLTELKEQHQPTKCFALTREKINAMFREHGIREISAKTVERLYYRWKNSGYREQALLDGRTWIFNRMNRPTADPKFRCHLGNLCTCQKKSEAIKELYRAWDAGETIPGYEGMNPTPNCPRPEGWSYDNLITKIPTQQYTKKPRS